MKPRKTKRGKKPSIVPEFYGLEMPPRVNTRLAEYGGKAGMRQDAIGICEHIINWRASLPASLKKLEESNATPEQVAWLRDNTSARVEWCKFFEDAIERNDAEFFDTVASVLRHRVNGSPRAHPAEYHAWIEFHRLLRASQRLSEDGKSVVSDCPTKGQIRAAVEAKGVTVTSWPRVWKRLNLDLLPKEKSGPRKRGVR